MKDLSFLQDLGMTGSELPVSTGVQSFGDQSQKFSSFSPVDGKLIGTIGKANLSDYQKMMTEALNASEKWRKVPAPKRGEVVRQIGDELRRKKNSLGMLVSYEMGKSLQEGLGEVQEMIDICDFAVGLSRQLYGNTMHSERFEHRMYEQWHPVGVVGIISAFNFPVAVWAWNAMLAMVCGNATVWKPSEKTPLSAVATFHILKSVLLKNQVPEGVCNFIVGDALEIGEALIHDARIPVVSATGSTRMGRRVGEVVGKRLGRSILELGGNNAIILSPFADLKLALPAIVFGAVGTCGQRCTTTRRLIVHTSLYESLKEQLVKAYSSLRIGSPLDENNHVGPLIDHGSRDLMQKAITQAKEQGGKLLYGGDVLTGPGYESGCYVRPAIIEARPDMEIVGEETFAPILYLLKYSGSIEDAIGIQNSVKQGLSSALFSRDLLEAERFLSHLGSDCGIANINIGTSGAEIGGAFGGEKETGGGRESGSDSWKAYMRRQTNTINYGVSVPLAQGIKFDI
ncbi:MAG: aldehyde dehydrogenase family protein [Pseudomonadota bacterium]